jgi:ABC-2 type transport system ATP-binding protein
VTGYLPEGVALYPEMRVGEYLRFRARLKGVPRSGRKAVIRKALEQAGVADMERRIIGTLSRGYRQRTGLADALLAEPKVLILDEPTVGLDPEQVRQFRQLLRDVGRDRTVILSTHILSEVEIACSAVVIIHRGRIVARDSAADLRKRFGRADRIIAEIAAPASELREALGADPRVASVSVEEAEGGAAGRTGGFRRVTIEPRGGDDLREAVFALARDRGWRLRELRRESVSLEEAFVSALAGGRP